MANVLVVCRSEAQRREAAMACGSSSWQFELIGAPLTGHRFDRIIVLSGDHHPDENRLIREVLPTRLEPKGELYVL